MKLTLLDYCADDLSVVNAARVSFAQKSDWEGWESDVSIGRQVLSERDAGLIDWLMRNRHGSPFEHGYFRFHVEAPIFVFREWHRHRVGHSYNEMSGRYTELEEKFFYPKEWRTQVGKPGAYTFESFYDHDAAEKCNSILFFAYKSAWSDYQRLLEQGVAKEQARMVLPLGIYSQMYWSCNPRSLMHFIGLRNAPDAQAEIRELAAEAENFLEVAMPVTWGSFVSNGRKSP